MKKNIIIISILLFVCLIPINTFGKSKGEVVTKSSTFLHTFPEILPSYRLATLPKGVPVQVLEEKIVDHITLYKITVPLNNRWYTGWVKKTNLLIMEGAKFKNGTDIKQLEIEKAGKAEQLEIERERKATDLAIKKEREAANLEAANLAVERLRQTEKLKIEKQRQVEKVVIENLEEKVRSIPASNYKDNLDIYRRLLKLKPFNKKYEKKVKYYSQKIKIIRENRRKEKERKKKELKLAKEREMVSMGYALKLLNWNWNSEHGYATAKGEVKNITNKRLKNIQALVSWYNANGDFITSDGAIIEYNILMPGQTSPFKVMERFNPQMKEAKIEFKFLFGRQIRFYK